ncbi:cation diffusion facilitator family transporter [Spiribacter halobius]|uniref:Cation transporter n=1 Tax=Sediminicurvatus halobius TaxID=2182432 RepID=A0A2U2N6N1_9GAMM|nr:cation diffusion facilitator family transporter [Spiribacter halobius]PWG64634.1 cation transporter [Spiribacter halobius]UEX79042.1 cation diffusion facilitator family transporter [Spiribacter halobius]
MASTHAPAPTAEHVRSAHRVTLLGALVNLVLSLVKIGAGLLAQSQALVADGLHSLSDLLSDVVVLLATRYGRQAPDASHPYGHERIETFGTLLVAGLLVLVAGAIAWEAIGRLQVTGPPVLLALALPVAVVSVLAKEALYQYTQRAAQRLRSDLLVANAWHHRSDAISSVIVLAGLGGVGLGLPWLDAVAALLLGGMIALMALRLGARAVAELVDTAPPEVEREAMRGAAEQVPEVRGVHDLRARQMAGRRLVDLHVEVAPEISVSEGHRIGHEVSRRLRRGFGPVDEVTFHIDPVADRTGRRRARGPQPPLRDALFAELFPDGLPQDVRCLLHYLDDRVSVDLLLPPGTPPPLVTARRPEWLEEIRVWQRAER